MYVSDLLPALPLVISSQYAQHILHSQKHRQLVHATETSAPFFGPQVMNEALAVVDHRFCAPYSLQLRLRERVSWSGDDFEIYQLPSKQTWFVIKGKAFSFRDEKKMQDVHGRTIATMRHPMFHPFHPKMEISGPGYSFAVRCWPIDVPKLNLLGIYHKICFVEVERCIGSIFEDRVQRVYGCPNFAHAACIDRNTITV